jgi:phosphate transport system protein
MADYAVSAVKFFVNNKVIDSIRTLSLNILKSALLTMNKVFISMKTNPAIDTYKICEVAHKNFRKEYISNLKTLSSILKKSTVDEISNLFQGAIVIIKHIERLVDHLSNICENFVFIKQSDFFFDKHSKQLDK